MTLLRAFMHGGIGGFILGFFFQWIEPVFSGSQPASFARAWDALFAVTFSGVLMTGVFGACFWAWLTFWSDTGFGRELRSWGRLFDLWR